MQREVSRYEVPVQPGRTLRELLNAASPIRTDGRIFHAYTHWNIHWHFRTGVRPDGRCGIDSVHTDLAVSLTLPGPTDPALSHRGDFITYLGALERHEQGHVDIGRQTAAAIDAGILALPAQADCAQMESAANAYAEAQLEAARVTEARYDQDTAHGRTQGAVLP